MLNSNMPSLSDIAAVVGNNDDNNGGFGNSGFVILVIIILFAVFGWGRGGFGNDGNDGGGGNTCIVPMGYSGFGGDMQRGFDTNMIQNRFNGLERGMCDSAYENAQLIAGVQNSMNQGFNGVYQGQITQGYETRLQNQAMQAQMQQCCCDIERDIQANTTQGVMNTNNLQRQISDCCCDMEKQAMQTRFDAQQDHCQTLQAIDKLGDRIENWLSSNEMQKVRDENLALKFQASQVAQNQFIKETVTPYPKPTFTVPNPRAFCYGNYGCNNGCQCCGF